MVLLRLAAGLEDRANKGARRVSVEIKNGIVMCIWQCDYILLGRCIPIPRRTNRKKTRKAGAMILTKCRGDILQ